MNDFNLPPTIFLTFDQGSEDWHEWRKTGYSASEAPAVMAEGRYFPKTPYQLYLLHTGQQTIEYNQAMSDGHRLESQIVAYASEQLSIKFMPACLERYPFKASLDGFAIEGDKNLVLEVKTSTKNSPIWENGSSIYKWQLVHQAIVAEADHVYFCVYAKDTDEYLLETVLISEHDKKLLITAWKSYGDMLENFEIPPLHPDLDYEVKKCEDTKRLVARFELLRSEKKQIEAKLKDVKQELIEAAKGQRFECEGVKVYPVKKGHTIHWVVK